MRQPIALPAHLVSKAEAFARGEAEPPVPKNAATVVLLRPGADGPEVYLMQRQSTMAFAAGFSVFPGGGVDPRDFDHTIAWAGPTPAEWADRLGVADRDDGEALARALVCAAVRETFEEAGVLLAGRGEHEVIADVSTDEWEAARQALESRELSMTQFLDERGLVLRSDLLSAWSGWLTPVIEERRYRTWFFVAALPAGQVTRDVSSESSSVLWLPAAEACRRVDDGELIMLPPTWLTCLEVSQYADPQAVLQAGRGRSVEMFTPQAEERDGQWFLSVPPDYQDLIDTLR